LSGGLAALTYHLIETPIRFGKYKHKNPAYLAGLLATVMVGALVVWGSGGSLARLGRSTMARLLADPPSPERHLPCSGVPARARSFRLPIDWCEQSLPDAPTAAI